MELNDHLKPPHEYDLPVVVETDHALLINGMSIPYVTEDGVVCKNHKGWQEVTITLLASSFVRMCGKASEAFEEERGGLKGHAEYTFKDEGTIELDGKKVMEDVIKLIGRKMEENHECTDNNDRRGAKGQRTGEAEGGEQGAAGDVQGS